MTILKTSRRLRMLIMASLALSGCEGVAAGSPALPQMRALQSQCLIEIPECHYDEVLKESYCGSACYTAKAVGK